MEYQEWLDVYGDWMVVKRKHKPKDNRGSSRKFASEATGRSEDVTHWNTPRAPRDIQADKGRDGKRKSRAEEGLREVRLVYSQLTQPHNNYSTSKSKKDELGLTKSGPKKLTQVRNSINHGEVDSING